MQKYEPIDVVPTQFQMYWQLRVDKATPTEDGVFRLVKIRTTVPGSYEDNRIIVLVVDEDGSPLPSVPVAFGYSTAKHYIIAPDFQWSPPSPYRAHVVPTTGGGEIEHIQGSPVKDGEPGGVSVYMLDPTYASDIVIGAGALADHTGLHLTFQLRRTGVEPVLDRLDRIEKQLAELQG